MAIVQIIVSAVFGIGDVAGVVVFAQAGSALATVFALATLAVAYNQLDEQPAVEDADGTDIGTATPA